MAIDAVPVARAIKQDQREQGPASPTVWRRWLAAELRRLRAEAGLEQKQVAKALRCTVTKVSYVENAQRPVVPRDLDEVLLPLYRVPEAVWPDYLDAAHKARQKGWWEDYDVDVMPEWFSRFVGLEQGASEMSAYESQYVPGLLQIPEYVEALIRSASHGFSEQQVARRVELRVRRQGVLTRAAAPLHLAVVLDEAVLRRIVGGPVAMRRQVEHLVAAAARPNVELQVLPFDRGAHACMGGGFTILGFPWSGDAGLGFFEGAWSVGVYFEQPDEIDEQRRAFRKLRDLALPVDESVAMMRAVARDLG
jgi:transcriptional regulator with XRE-family HTH domain